MVDIEKYITESQEFDETLFADKRWSALQGIVDKKLGEYEKRVLDLAKDIQQDMLKMVKLIASKHTGNEELTIDFVEMALKTYIANHYAVTLNHTDNWLNEFIR